MKRSGVLIAVTFMLLATVGFISLPAYAGENPWDADDGHHTEVDTSWVNPHQLGIHEEVGVSPNPDWLNSVLVRVSFVILDTYTDLFCPEPEVTRVVVYKAKVK